MCQAFADAGHKVQLISPAYPDKLKISEQVLADYAVRPNFSIRELPWYAVKGQASVYAVLAGIAVKRFGAHLAYGRDVKACAFSAFFGVPTVYEVHGPQPQQAWDRWLFKKLIAHRNCKGIVCISDALKKIYLDSYPGLAGKIVVAHDGADEPSAQSATEHMDKKDDTFDVGYVGGLYPGRGIPLIINLAKACDWATFHIVGGSRQEIDDWRLQCDPPANLHFHGYLPYAAAAGYMRYCDVLLAPYEKKVSIFQSESADTSEWMSPLKIFEYMAAGRAIISSNHDVIKEVLEHERNAIMVDPDDTEGWIAALRRLHDDRSLRLRLGSAGVEDLRLKYSWQVRARRLVGLFGNNQSRGDTGQRDKQENALSGGER